MTKEENKIYSGKQLKKAMQLALDKGFKLGKTEAIKKIKEIMNKLDIKYNNKWKKEQDKLKGSKRFEFAWDLLRKEWLELKAQIKQSLNKDGEK